MQPGGPSESTHSGRPPMRVLRSGSLDPYWNLALEDVLLQQFAVDAPTLLLWRSADAVIIGKNQNPWRECDLTWMTGNEVALARRISGGGAVYHDHGNLNYAFFLPRIDYRQELIFDLLTDVLAGFGLTAERVNRTSLVVDGLKVSGNAFCYRRDGVLHHGTLLVDANLDRVRRALRPPAATFETRATASVRMPVANLTAWRPELTVGTVEQALMARCGATEATLLPVGAMPVVDAACDQMRTWDWLYGRTPPFTVEQNGQKQHVVAGRIESGTDDGRIGEIFTLFSGDAD